MRRDAGTLGGLIVRGRKMPLRLGAENEFLPAVIAGRVKVAGRGLGLFVWPAGKEEDADAGGAGMTEEAKGSPNGDRGGGRDDPGVEHFGNKAIVFALFFAKRREGGFVDVEDDGQFLTLGFAGYRGMMLGEETVELDFRTAALGVEVGPVAPLVGRAVGVLFDAVSSNPEVRGLARGKDGWVVRGFRESGFERGGAWRGGGMVDALGRGLARAGAGRRCDLA